MKEPSLSAWTLALIRRQLADELQRTYEWRKSWNFLETGGEATDLVNMNVQNHGYERAPHESAAL